MTFKKNKLHNNEFPTLSETLPPSDLRKNNHILLRFAALYGFWLLMALVIYWPVLPAIPYRDQPDLMRNHQLAQTDWQWFLSVLSYNRTRILAAGDYFAFRPLHMAIIALQDIFLRYHMLAQGVVKLGFTNEGIMLFADGLFVAEIPGLPPKMSYVNVALRSTGNKPADFGNMYVSQLPSSGFMQVTPRYLLTRR